MEKKYKLNIRKRLQDQECTNIEEEWKVVEYHIKDAAEEIRKI